MFISRTPDLHSIHSNIAKYPGLSSVILCAALCATPLLSSCANVDRGLMKVSDAISSRDPVTGAREINLMSEQQEISRGTQASQQLMQQARQKKIPVDQQLPQYGEVLGVFNRLKQVVHRKNLPWEVHLIGQQTWNAFTVGGGKIFVFQGLMQGQSGVRNPDELAVVLAHEMAHNTARHLGERQGKTLLTQLADKNTRNNLYQASFSTNQEYEADKFSVIYMALAGYDPMAAVNVWTRMARTKGSYSADMMHTHPLNADRARRLQGYATQARQYYQPGRINPQAAQFVKCNRIYCNRSNGNTAQAGQGGGTAAFLETIANAYVETAQAKHEAKNRQQARQQQLQKAAGTLRFSDVKLVKNTAGRPGASGVAQNLTNRSIRGGIVGVQYYLNNKQVHQHSVKWPAMSAGSRKPFTIPLKSGNYDRVRLVPELVQ